MRGSRAATTRRPRTCRAWRTTCCGIGSCSASRPKRRDARRTRSSTRYSRGSGCPDMTAQPARISSSPVQVTLADLVRLRPAGESLRLTAPRIRVATEGGHVSPYKGRGVEFDESRPYQPGDDLRTMDWRVTARTGRPHTKVFREERNRPVFVWLDLRRPMLFATRGAYKGVR